LTNVDSVGVPLQDAISDSFYGIVGALVQKEEKAVESDAVRLFLLDCLAMDASVRLSLCDFCFPFPFSLLLFLCVVSFLASLISIFLSLFQSNDLGALNRIGIVPFLASSLREHLIYFAGLNPALNSLLSSVVTKDKFTMKRRPWSSRYGLFSLFPLLFLSVLCLSLLSLRFRSS
jgi:hypothetical protein